MTDSATEFTSEYFSNFLQRFDVKTTTIAPHAHWQNGHCERHGHVPQEMLSKIEAEHPINTYMEMHQALIQCNQEFSKYQKRILTRGVGFWKELTTAWVHHK